MDAFVVLLDYGHQAKLWASWCQPALRYFFFSPLLHPICPEDRQLWCEYNPYLPTAAAGTVPKSPVMSRGTQASATTVEQE